MNGDIIAAQQFEGELYIKASDHHRAVKAAVEAEREKVAQWMIQRSYATGHGETIEDLLAELDWQIAENWNRAMINGMKTEREACAEVLDAMAEKDKLSNYYQVAALAIRARGQG